MLTQMPIEKYINSVTFITFPLRFNYRREMLPDHPFTINGGCNCGSIRYKINSPKFEERPLLTYCDDHAISEMERFPKVLIDHCNDCRRATGALLPVWIACPTSFLELTINSRSIPAEDFLKKEDMGTRKEGPLRFYQSSDARFRGFCENCGTMLVYRSAGFPPSWPDVVDILLGTIDRDDLKQDWMKPERELWWEMGIPWIQELIRNGTAKEKMPRHPLWKVNHDVPSNL